MIPARFRKRAVIVEAVQLTVANREEVLAWLQGFKMYAYLPAHGLVIGTADGETHVLPGDFVVHTGNGAFVRMAGGTFWDTYEHEGGSFL